MNILNNKKKILIVGNPNHIFVKNLVIELKKNYNHRVDILSCFDKYNSDEVYYDNLFEIKANSSQNSKSRIVRKFSIIYSYIKTIFYIRKLKMYDAINIQYVNKGYLYLFNTMIKKTKKTILTFWGSDFYRISSKEKNKLKGILDKATLISFTNEQTSSEFGLYYNDYSEKIMISRFGLEALSEIKKLLLDENLENKINDFIFKYGLDESKKNIVCGYNASKQQQHLEILENLNEIQDRYKEEIMLVFPMTYGDKSNIIEVEDKLKKTKFKYVIFKEYMQNEEVALLRLITDIMINVQTTDQLSGSMQETLFAGNVVINGSWLPYDVFEANGAKYLKIDNLNKLKDVIENSLDNLENIKNETGNNKELIWKLSSWENTIKMWNELY